MQSASIAFAKAKAAIEVTAILNVLYERTGSEQSRVASDLLSRIGGSMPAVVKVELEKEVQNSNLFNCNYLKAIF